MSIVSDMSSEERQCFNWYIDNKNRQVDRLLRYRRLFRRFQCPCNSAQLIFTPHFRMNRVDFNNNLICYASLWGTQSAVSDISFFGETNESVIVLLGEYMHVHIVNKPVEYFKQNCLKTINVL